MHNVCLRRSVQGSLLPYSRKGLAGRRPFNVGMRASGWIIFVQDTAVVLDMHGTVRVETLV